MIPAFTHNKVFFGHDFVTYQAQERLKELAIVFSPESPHFESTNLPKLDLQLIFSNSQNRIYQIN